MDCYLDQNCIVLFSRNNCWMFMDVFIRVTNCYMVRLFPWQVLGEERVGSEATSAGITLRQFLLKCACVFCSTVCSFVQLRTYENLVCNYFSSFLGHMICVLSDNMKNFIIFLKILSSYCRKHNREIWKLCNRVKLLFFIGICSLHEV